MIIDDIELEYHDLEDMIDLAVERDQAFLTHQYDDSPALEPSIWIEEDQPDPNI